jgi:DNA-binding NarL/FixJ family response regulator
MANLNTSPVVDAESFGAKTGFRPSSTPIIRVLLADDPSVFRDGLRSVLCSHPDIQVIAEAPDRSSVLELARLHRPDIILLEPDGDSSLQMLRDLYREKLPSRIILLTSATDSDMRSQAVRCGVAGILSKKSPTELLLKSIRKVNAGELWLDRTTSAEVVRELAAKPIPMPRHAPVTEKPAVLSRREREIVALVAQGFRNREIADKLFISEQTVKNHMHNIFEKIGVQDRLELALYAIYHRLYE